MNKFSVHLENLAKDSEAQAILRENPQALRNILAAINVVVEAALTGGMSKPLVPIVGPADCIYIQPDRIFLVAQRVNRMRCHLLTGELGPVLIGANIDFIDGSGNVVVGINACADSDGIRRIARVYQRTSINIGTLHKSS